MSGTIETSPEQARVWHLEEEPHLAEGHSTPLGFWMYLMSDSLIFAILFATYAVSWGIAMPVVLTRRNSSTSG